MRFHSVAHGVHAVCAAKSSSGRPTAGSENRENAPTGGGGNASVGVMTTSTSDQAAHTSSGNACTAADASATRSADNDRPQARSQVGIAVMGVGSPAQRAAMTSEKTANRSTEYGGSTGATPATPGWVTSSAVAAPVALATDGSTGSCEWKGRLECPTRTGRPAVARRDTDSRQGTGESVTP